MRFGPAAMLAALASLALIAPGCGEERAATAGDGGATTGGSGAARGEADSARRVAPLAASRCRRPLGEFLDAMESLTNTLAVGLDYGAYLETVERVRATYAGVPTKRLRLGCLARVARPAERALNLHIAAVNAWGECLADSSCEPESVEPGLQRRWRAAGDLLAEARARLRRIG